VVDVLDHVWGVGQLYAAADPQPHAAMPALHVSVPALISATWTAVRGWGRPSSWLAFLYPITVAYGSIYLGEHYLLDVVAGAALGIASYLVIAAASPRLTLGSSGGVTFGSGCHAAVGGRSKWRIRHEAVRSDHEHG
jgi:membrane-associated phospholipid phosphatase